MADDIEQRLIRAHAAARASSAEQRRSATELRAAVQAARANNWTIGEIASLLGVSRSRVQALADHR